LSDPKDVKLY
jgi:hypothetical protein